MRRAVAGAQLSGCRRARSREASRRGRRGVIGLGIGWSDVAGAGALVPLVKGLIGGRRHVAVAPPRVEPVVDRSRVQTSSAASAVSAATRMSWGC